MSDEKRRDKTPITVAIIGVVGILGGAVFANWDKIFPPPTPSQHPEASVAVSEAPAEPDPSPKSVPDSNPELGLEPVAPAAAELSAEDALTLAEEMTAQWLTAWDQQDLEGLMALTGAPFYFDQGVLMSPTDIRAKYAEGLDNTSSGSIRYDSIRASEVGELKQQGMLDRRDRILSNMRINDNDVAVIVMVQGEGIIYFFRRTGSTLKMAGFWD